VDTGLFQHTPLTRRGRILFYLNLLLIAALILAPLPYYWILPDRVPSHWNAEGEITSYSSKVEMILLLSTLMPLANIVLALITRFRWTILNKYPYLISIPGIAVVLYKTGMDPETRSRVMNRVFEATLAAGLLVGLFMLGIEVLVLESMRGGLASWLVLVYAFAGSLAVLLLIFLLYRSVYRGFLFVEN